MQGLWLRFRIWRLRSRLKALGDSILHYRTALYDAEGEIITLSMKVIDLEAKQWISRN